MHRLASLLPEANAVSQGDLGDTFPFRFIPKYRYSCCPAVVFQEAVAFNCELLDVWNEVRGEFCRVSNDDLNSVKEMAS